MPRYGERGGSVSADWLKGLCDQHMISGEELGEILQIYADYLEQNRPEAVNEIEAARRIGLSIQEILEEQA